MESELHEMVEKEWMESIQDELVGASFFDVIPPLDETECEELDQC